MKDFKNSTRTQSGHSFPSEAGFTGSTGMVKMIKPYTRKVPSGPTAKFAQGGSVDNATTQRDQPSNELDAEAGGKSPLRPGFKKGGKPVLKKAVGGYAKGGKSPKGYGKFNGKPLVEKC